MRARRLLLGLGAAILLILPAAAVMPAPPSDPDAFLHPLSRPGGGMNSPDFLGRSLFERDWAIAPGPQPGLDGLGPYFSRLSCDGCHTHAGRGEPPPGPGYPLVSMTVRLSVPGAGPDGGPRPDPHYGAQLDRNAVPGVPVEGRVSIGYREISGRYADGEPYALRAPEIRVSGHAFGPLAPGAVVATRVAPALVGLGLLEAVPAATIEALAREEAREGRVHGRPNRVWDAASRTMRLGRFGWKAGEPSLEQQTASAFNLDIGITNPLYPANDCGAVERACRAAAEASPRHPKIGRDFVAAVTGFIADLKPPPRRDVDDPEARRGAVLFDRAGCGACHRPSLEIAGDAATGAGRRVIHPYTDLLLHDMGDGLADGRREFAADSRRWRTAPLWGIGLIEAVNGRRYLLHDGRARSLAEAILWHGGEAAASGRAFRALSRADRAALIAFLDSL